MTQEPRANPDSDSAKIGRRIRQLREQRQWTQIRLAHKTGLALATISRLEQGTYEDQRLSTLRTIADAFEVQVADLLTEPDGQPAEKGA
jgi:transcriptional regulator with XRE-family HTH domain